MDDGYSDFYSVVDLLKAMNGAGVRYLVIGRQAWLLYGLPVQTFDYNLWVDPAQGNVRALIEVAEPFGLSPSIPEEALPRRPFFRFENGTRIDVWKVREFALVSGEALRFETAYARRETRRDDARGLALPVPCITDLVFLKRLGNRPKDREDIRMLQALTAGGPGGKEA
ncbi:MAG: hypothetical protein HZA54_15060 [Planctomycetes bacterium]|nr:hypothetical protein [Planctomycetota bacterium]